MSARWLRLILKPQARNDLRSALLYTREQWGAEQRARYKALLYRSMQELIGYPELGRARDGLYPGCRSQPVGQRVIYYHVTEPEVVVVRILHGRQDAAGEVTEPGP